MWELCLRETGSDSLEILSGTTEPVAAEASRVSAKLNAAQALCRSGFGKDAVDTKVRYFELTMWPHVRAAHNFARWLVRNNHDAEDIVQESFLKAYKALDTFRGGDARVWMLSIVRNTAMNFLRARKPDVTVNWSVQESELEDHAPDPERGLLEQSRRERVRRAISHLAPEFREAIVLREIEELSYKEIASVLNIPIGTVMSRLSRARNLLLVELSASKEVRHDLP